MIDRPLTLHWTPGDNVQATNEHDIYLGTNEALVDSNDASVFKANRDVNNWPVPAGSLRWGETYYWKVNEVNGAAEWPGNVWSFTMSDYIQWEDFERFEPGGQGAQDIEGTWIKVTGTGASIDVGTTTGNDPVNSGSRSMEYGYYHNAMAGKYYSEAYRDFDAESDPCDWSYATGGVKSLRLYFYGDPGNIPVDMYVVLEDSNTNDSMKLYDGSSSDLGVDDWQEWDIDLSWFTDGTNDVHLGYIKKICIGFGVRGATTIVSNFGAVSLVYFDDFRVYPPHCVPDRLKPVSDINGSDCFVNYVDLGLMAYDWGDYDYTITPSDPNLGPGDSNLIGYWNFDDGTANDSSGNNHDGTPVVGDANTSIGFVYDAVRDSNVLDCNNPVNPVVHTINSVVDCGTGSWTDITGAITLAAWTKVRTIHTTNYLLTKSNIYQMASVPDGQARVYLENTVAQAQYSTSSLLDDKWHHFAFTYDPAAEERKVYFDGYLETSEHTTGALGTDPCSFVIGGRLQSTFTHRGWNGLIDEVRLYDDVLTQAEVVYLITGSTSPEYFPIRSLANLTDTDDPVGSRFVNFKDYNVLADAWLEELLWPSGW